MNTERKKNTMIKYLAMKEHFKELCRNHNKSVHGFFYKL